MNFVLNTIVPVNLEYEQWIYGSLKENRGLQWKLMAKRVEDENCVELCVKCSQIDELSPSFCNFAVEFQNGLSGCSDRVRFEHFDKNRLVTRKKSFAIENLVETYGGYEMSVAIRVIENGRWAPAQNAEATDKAINDKKNLKAQILELKNSFEEKCAKMEATLMEFMDNSKSDELFDNLTAAWCKSEKQREDAEKQLNNERVNFADKEFELQREIMKLKADMEELTSEPAQLKKIRRLEEGNASLKDVIKHLKTELEVANEKVLQAEPKIELLQHVVIDTEAMMYDLKEKLESALVVQDIEATEKNTLIENLKALESAVKEKDATIERLEAENKSLLWKFEKKKMEKLNQEAIDLKKMNDDLEAKKQRERDDELINQLIRDLGHNVEEKKPDMKFEASRQYLTTEGRSGMGHSRISKRLVDALGQMQVRREERGASSSQQPADIVDISDDDE